MMVSTGHLFSASFALFTLFFTACAPKSTTLPAISGESVSSPFLASGHSIPSLPEPAEVMGGIARVFRCVRGIDANPTWLNKSSAELLQWLAHYNVSVVGTEQPSQLELAQFAAEFERIPEAIRVSFQKHSGHIHLLRGHGVSEDPTWASGLTTFDGRNWSIVPGSGGAPYVDAGGGSAPTRFVLNRLYEGHGSVNLVLHEFGHSFDSMVANFGLSSRDGWLSITKYDVAFREAVGSLCGIYCTDHSSEGFAESFAAYHACDGSRDWLTQNAGGTAAWISAVSTAL